MTSKEVNDGESKQEQRTKCRVPGAIPQDLGGVPGTIPKVMEAGQPYLKTWTEPLELFQQTIAASASYLKTWAETLEQFQKVMEASAPYLKTWT
ncbi:MAG: hypothetical protein ACXWPG_01185 [Ktedonobacteraceae bacterium]